MLSDWKNPAMMCVWFYVNVMQSTSCKKIGVRLSGLARLFGLPGLEPRLGSSKTAITFKQL